MITLYGIPNCSTVKKARQWLSDQNLNYTFHDFKKQGIDAASLTHWIDAIGLDKLINRQGTTWRGLSDELKNQATQINSAILLMQNHSSIIKRPVLLVNGQISVGFNAIEWAERLLK
ncbi:arsenate reductase [Neisseriaceae bacterium TC5R-5]|nr:arsenate reductase [Neisseriaceae bacterium TC5R-5]